MTWKTKLTACLIALLIAFAGGAGLGYHYAKSHPIVRTVFTPYEDGLAAYLGELDKAQESVHIAAYAFTDIRIADKLVELIHKRKVKVYVLMDQSQTRGWSAPSERKVVEALRAAGAEVIIGTSEKSHEIMHNKFTIIDGRIVEDGSWNYSKAANFQANVLNFVEDYDRSQKFLKYWHRMAKFMRTQPQELPEPKADSDAEDDKPKAKDERPTRRRK